MEKRAFYAACLLAFLVVCSPVFADDAIVNQDWSNTGSGYSWMAEHEDAAPFKGSVTVTATNTGSENWGDFHFRIVDYMGLDISEVDFVAGFYDGNDWDPTVSINSVDLILGTDFTYAIDNDVTGATMDLFFYDDPVGPTDEIELTVYTHNKDQVGFFGLAMYPTPVPEPATVALLGMGALVLLRKKARR